MTAVGGWHVELDRLELHVDRAEQLIGAPAGLDAAGEPRAWQVPTGLGPLPEEFIPRARLLLERQRRLMALIPSVLADNRQQQRVADRVSGATTAPTSPVYVDVSA